MGATSREQTSFRLRNDDDSESAASWKQLINVDDTINVDENFRIRFGYTVGGMDGGQACQLEYNLAGAGWNPVNATSIVVRSFTTTHVADNATITEQLDQGNTFTANTTPNGGFDEVDGLVSSQDLVLGEECEVEYCVQIRSADVVDAQTLQLRITRAGSAFDTYTNEPTITVSEAAPDLSPEEAESFSQGQQQPVMRAAGIVFAAALLASGLAIYDPETINDPEAAAVEQWWQPWPGPVQEPPGNAYNAAQSAASGAVDDQETIGFSGVPPDTSIEDWWQAWPEPVLEHPAAHHAAALAASGLFPSPQIDSAVRVTWARLEVPLADAVEAQDDIEHWFQAWSEPVPPRAGLHASQQQALAIDPETIGDPELTERIEWYAPWSEPVRAKFVYQHPAAFDDQETIGDPSPVPPDESTEWWVAWSEPVPPQAGLDAANQLALVDDPETIGDAAPDDESIEDWWTPFALPTLGQAGLHASLQAQPTNPDALFQAAPPAPPTGKKSQNPMIVSLGRMMNR